MQGVLEGFGVIALIILVGVIVGRTGVLGASGQQVISRIVFYIATPALLFSILSTSEVDSVFSGALAVTAISAVLVAVVFFLIATLIWKRDSGQATVGAWASSYVNAGNLGIPIAVYVLGTASYMAPVMMFQLIVLAPIGMSILDTATAGHHTSIWRRLSSPLRNPVLIGSLVGLVVALTGVHVPELIEQPITLIGNISVPGALLAFGISLREGWKAPAKGSRRDLALIVVLKLGVQPLAAYLLARFVFGIGGIALLAATVTAALPTAQNVFIYAMRYSKGITLARDAALVTTFLSAPVILVVAALLS